MKRAWVVINRIGKDNLFKVSDNELEKSLSAEGVNNHIDRKMVIETLEFIKNIDSHNIVAYSLKGINSGQTIIIFDELRKIFGIGPKLASLFLRDVCFVYKVEPVVREQLICLQPVDTWVMQVSIELGIPGCVKEINRNAVVEPIVDYCLKNKISPLLFNAGAWYVGARAFSLLIKSL